MADDSKGAPGADGGKPGDAGAGNSKPDEMVPRARVDEVTARAKRAEEQLAQLKEAQESDRKKALEKNQEFGKLYEEEKAKAAQLGAIQAAVGEYLKAELEGLTDAQKALVPNLPDHEKINWVKKARSAGVFGSKPGIPPTFNNPPGSNTGEWWLDLKPSDPKLQELSSEQYLKWKAKNKSAAAGIKGGF